MRSETDRRHPDDGANIPPLEWESLGRLVRRCALEAVALHFAATGAEATRGDRDRRRVRSEPDCEGLTSRVIDGLEPSER